MELKFDSRDLTSSTRKRTFGSQIKFSKIPSCLQVFLLQTPRPFHDRVLTLPYSRLDTTVRQVVKWLGRRGATRRRPKEIRNKDPLNKSRICRFSTPKPHPKTPLGKWEAHKAKLVGFDRFPIQRILVGAVLSFFTLGDPQQGGCWGGPGSFLYFVMSTGLPLKI